MRWEHSWTCCSDCVLELRWSGDVFYAEEKGCGPYRGRASWSNSHQMSLWPKMERTNAQALPHEFHEFPSSLECPSCLTLPHLAICSLLYISLMLQCQQPLQWSVAAVADRVLPFTLHIT